MVGGGVWLWWAYRTYDICTLLSLQYFGREGGGGLVGNNTLQLKFSSICFYCIISSKPWGGGGKLFRERVYNIFIYTQLFRVKNFSSICLYCIIVSVHIYTSHPPHPIFIFLIYCIHVGGGRWGGIGCG